MPCGNAIKENLILKLIFQLEKDGAMAAHNSSKSFSFGRVLRTLGLCSATRYTKFKHNHTIVRLITDFYFQIRFWWYLENSRTAIKRWLSITWRPVNSFVAQHFRRILNLLNRSSPSLFSAFHEEISTFLVHFCFIRSICLFVTSIFIVWKIYSI